MNARRHSYPTSIDAACQNATRDAVTFIQPGSFNPSEFLKADKLWKYADDARYFIDLIMRKLARKDTDQNGLVRLYLTRP